MKSAAILTALTLVLASCGNPGNQPKTAEGVAQAIRYNDDNFAGDEIETADPEQPPPADNKRYTSYNDGNDNGGRYELVRMTDPNEQAFTVGLPKGWTNEAYSSRYYEVCRFLATCMSPDGRTYLAIGDDKEPWYSVPNQLTEQFRELANSHPLQKVRPYTSAEQIFPEIIRRKFGNMPGLTLGSGEADQAKSQEMMQDFARKGMNANITCMRFPFSFMANGEKINAILLGSLIAGGGVWGPDFGIIYSKDDPSKYLDLYSAICASNKTSEAWKQSQNARHEARIAQLRRDHQMRMNNMMVSHNMRMQAIQQFGEQNTRNFNSRMDAMDANHRSFINMIRGESTVASGTHTYQVDNSYQRYYLNKLDNTYIGTDVHTGIDDLRKFNLNPDNYEEMQVLH